MAVSAWIWQPATESQYLTCWFFLAWGACAQDVKIGRRATRGQRLRLVAAAGIGSVSNETEEQVRLRVHSSVRWMRDADMEAPGTAFAWARVRKERMYFTNHQHRDTTIHHDDRRRSPHTHNPRTPRRFTHA
jgi:hypothetical protein